MKEKENIKIKYSYRYNATIETPYGTIFNHGTESKLGDRTKQHIKNAKESELEYKIFSEKSDGIIGK
jgi:hypothetical protein